VQVKSAPEESESADALRAVADDITEENFIILSVDLLTDIHLEVSNLFQSKGTAFLGGLVNVFAPRVPACM
jgi:NDP-sugar pyrophosphorylase family protein